jgi:WhiB family transcriptional regulator, redox-sensing transcriptional regulator
VTTWNRLAHADTLFVLLTQLVVDDFAGHPACAEVDSELFFPEVGDTSTVVKAKAICAGCEIREACADRAVRGGEPFGVWGGTTPTERREMRRALRESPQRTAA